MASQCAGVREKRGGGGLKRGENLANGGGVELMAASTGTWAWMRLPGSILLSYI